MTSETLLLLGAGTQQLPAIEAAKALGLRVVAIDPNPAAPGRSLVDQFYQRDLAEHAECLQLARQERVGGVLTLAADYPVPLLAFLCRELSLRGLSPEAARVATNKRAMRAALEAAGVPSPRSIAVESLAEAGLAVQRLGGSVIVKPALSSGGRGITRLPERPTSAAVRVACEEAAAVTRAAGVLFEEFVEGPEYSVESLTVSGTTHLVTVTDKLTTDAPFYVEIGHSQPSGTAERSRDAIHTVVRAALAALGIDDAAAHSELRLGARGPVVIEVGARLAGGGIATHLVPLSTGVDLVRAAIQLAMGRDVELVPQWERGAAIRFLTPQPGRVRSVLGVAEAERIPGVRLVSVAVGPGDLVRPLRDSRDRVGYVIADGPDRAAAIATAERAKQTVRIATEATAARGGA